MPSPRLKPYRLIAALVAAGPFVTALVWPQLFEAQRTPILSHIVAFRAPTAIALCAGSALFAAVASRNRTWGIAAGLAVALGLGAIASGAILLSRGADIESAEGEVVVVTWNTQGRGALATDVAQLILDADADIASLPETDGDTAEEVARLLAAEGKFMSAHTAHGGVSHSDMPTSVLIAEELGEYRVDREAGTTLGLASLVLRPLVAPGPTVVAAHSYPPLPGRMDTWRLDLQWVADRCDSADVIIAGDLNATVDHLSGLGDGDALVGSCFDAALSAGTAAVGTWPTSVPSWLASPIDHVLMGSAWFATGAYAVTSLDQAGSDHRPLVAVLARR